jgi:hypothetical protein
MNFLKTWLLAALTVFLTVVKKAIKIAKNEAIASAKTYTDNTATSTLQSAKSYTDQEIATLATSVGSITGGYKGAFATKALMDAVTAKAGDWAILSVDDGSNESGIYVRGATNFSFVLDIAAFSEIKTEILASNSEFETGTSTEKTATVKQIKDALATITSQLDDYALKGGDSANKFLVADASVNTKEAVNASQFDFTITDAEAQTAWDAINVDEPAYNFDVENVDWSAKGVIDQASFVQFLIDKTNYSTVNITAFEYSTTRIKANISATGGDSITFNDMNITKINTIIGGFSNIFNIDIRDNQLTEIPNELAVPADVLNVLMSGNPFQANPA